LTVAAADNVDDDLLGILYILFFDSLERWYECPYWHYRTPRNGRHTRKAVLYVQYLARST